MNTSTNIIDELRAKAKASLEDVYRTKEEFIPVAFILKDGKVEKVAGFAFHDDRGKADAIRKVGNLCSELDCTEIVAVFDCLYREIEEDENNEYVKDNWDTERPSTYPEKMQKHMLVLIHIDFMEGTKVDMLKYERGETIKYVSEEYDLDNEGGEIYDNICFGFLMGEVHKMDGKTNPDDAITFIKEKYPVLKNKRGNE